MAGEVNYTVSSFTLSPQANLNWGLQDLGSVTPNDSFLFYGSFQYGADGNLDNGEVPLTMTIIPNSGYTVSASNFSIAGRNYDYIEQGANPEASIVANGYVWDYEFNGTNLQTGDLPNGVRKVCFTDSFAPGVQGNTVIVLAWLYVGYNMPPVDVDLVLDIDGDADEIIIPPQPPPQYISLTCPELLAPNEGDWIGVDFYLEMANQQQSGPHTVGYTITADDSLNIHYLTGGSGSTPDNTDLILPGPDLNPDAQVFNIGTNTTNQCCTYGLASPQNITVINNPNSAGGCFTLTLDEFDSVGVATGGFSCTTCITGDPISGCTDSTACNYNAAATVDDGSCSYSGCTDETAENYNPCATIDDGSCLGSENRLIKISVELASEDHNMELHTNKGISPVMGVGGNYGNQPEGNGWCDGNLTNSTTEYDQQISIHYVQGQEMVQFARSTLTYGDLDSPICPEATSEEECGDQASFYMSIFPEIGVSNTINTFETYPTIGNWLTAPNMSGSCNFASGPINFEQDTYRSIPNLGNNYASSDVNKQLLLFLIKPKPGYALSRHNLRVEHSSEAESNEFLNGYNFPYTNPSPSWVGPPIYKGISPHEGLGKFKKNFAEYSYQTGAHNSQQIGQCLTRDCMFRDENGELLTCGSPIPNPYDPDNPTFLGNQFTTQYAVNYDLYANGLYIETKSSVVTPGYNDEYVSPPFPTIGLDNRAELFRDNFGYVLFTDRFNEDAHTGNSGIPAIGTLPSLYSITYPPDEDNVAEEGRGDFDWRDNGYPCSEDYSMMLQTNFEAWWNGQSTVSMKRCLDPSLTDITYNSSNQNVEQLVDSNGFYFNDYESSDWNSNFVFFNPMGALQNFNYMEYPDVDEIRFKILGKAMPITGQQMPDPTDFNIDIIDS